MYPDHDAPYSAHVNAHGQGTPLPPDGLRPGQLGVVLLGRVIVGGIAATLVDLAGREIVRSPRTRTPDPARPGLSVSRAKGQNASALG